MILDETAVRDMLNATFQRPLMWAATREAFVARLAVLLDVLGYEGKALYRSLPRSGNAMLDPAAPLDDAWADILTKHARLILGESL